jgi:hypothetical protein
VRRDWIAPERLVQDFTPMAIRLASTPPYRVRCDECGGEGVLPRHTVSWWCPRGDEPSVFAPDLQEKLAAPYAHLAEMGDGSPPRVFLLVPPE